MGWETTATQGGSIALGEYATSTGWAALSAGTSTTSSGRNSVAIGKSTTSSGDYSAAIGQETVASGLNSFAFGMGDATGTNPIVSGASSFGIFMGDQSGVNITTANTMAVMGGSLLINPDAPTNTTSAAASALHVIGDIRMTGVLIDVSDERLKTDIKKLNSAGSLLERLEQINGYSFRMKNNKNGQIEYGVMAQEIERVFPEIVQTANDEMGTKSVSYLGLIAPMIEATKELKAENDALKAQIEDHDNKIAALEASMEERMASLEQNMDNLKIYTGYGTEKAAIGILALIAMLGFFGAFVIIRKPEETS